MVRAGLVPAPVLLLVLLGCGGVGSGSTTSPAKTVSRSHGRYTPGDPQCDARRRPGTVGDIGEDVTGGRVPVRDFVACYGPPVVQKRQGVRRCLYYHTRTDALYWEFCAADGKIVSAAGGRSGADLR